MTKPSCSLSPGGVGVIAQFAYEESGKEHSASALLPHLPYSQIEQGGKLLDAVFFPGLHSFRSHWHFMVPQDSVG